MRARSLIVASAAAFTHSLASAGIFGPNNYDECVLAAMKGVTSDIAARAIMRSCREKYPPKVPASVNLPPAALAAIDGRARMDTVETSLVGDIYNGTNNWMLTSITVRLTPAVNGKPVAGALGRDFVIPLSVAPLSNELFYHRVGAGDWRGEVHWVILSARGYQK